MSISAECNRLVVSVAQPEETIYVLEPETGDILQDDIYYYDNSPTQSPALSANGDYLAFSDFSGQGTLMHWNGERYELVWKTNITSSYASSSWGCGNAISADGKYVAFGTLDFVSSGYDGTVFSLILTHPFHYGHTKTVEARYLNSPWRVMEVSWQLHQTVLLTTPVPMPSFSVNKPMNLIWNSTHRAL